MRIDQNYFVVLPGSVIYFLACLSVFFCEWTHITNEKTKEKKKKKKKKGIGRRRRSKEGTIQATDSDFLKRKSHNNDDENDRDIATTTSMK